MEKNKFGEGRMYDQSVFTEDDRLFITSTACLTLQTETLKWANFQVYENVDDGGCPTIAALPELSDAIIILSCQVTDLAILNDLRTLEWYMEHYPNKQFYVGGCLAQRFDIELPEEVRRLEHLRSINTVIREYNLLSWEKPFWVKDFNSTATEGDGKLFRNETPLMLSGGCHGRCEFCTIKVTRGRPYRVPFTTVDAKMSEKDADDFVFIGDTITYGQILKTANTAIRNDKIVSYRNVEPTNLVKAEKIIMQLANRGLLKVMHCPVQSCNPDVLELMKRDVDDTLKAIEICRKLKVMRVYTATNIIIDYTDANGKRVDDQSVFKLDSSFDHIAWNPYWNGVWDRKLAEERFEKYIVAWGSIE